MNDQEIEMPKAHNTIDTDDLWSIVVARNINDPKKTLRLRDVFNDISLAQNVVVFRSTLKTIVSISTIIALRMGSIDQDKAIDIDKKSLNSFSQKYGYSYPSLHSWISETRKTDCREKNREQVILNAFEYFMGLDVSNHKADATNHWGFA